MIQNEIIDILGKINLASIASNRLTFCWLSRA